jgi:hypothetical protein
MIMIMEQEDDDPARRASAGKPRPPRAKKQRKGNPVHRAGGQEAAPAGGNPTPDEPKDTGEEPRSPEGTPGQSPSVSDEDGPATPFPPEQ